MSLFSIIPLPVSDIAIALTAIFGFSSIIFDYDILLIYKIFRYLIITHLFYETLTGRCIRSQGRALPVSGERDRASTRLNAFTANTITSGHSLGPTFRTFKILRNSLRFSVPVPRLHLDHFQFRMTRLSFRQSPIGLHARFLPVGSLLCLSTVVVVWVPFVFWICQGPVRLQR